MQITDFQARLIGKEIGKAIVKSLGDNPGREIGKGIWDSFIQDAMYYAESRSNTITRLFKSIGE